MKKESQNWVSSYILENLDGCLHVYEMSQK